MSVLIALAALGLLMLAAYRGYSVILFAPIAALGAVLVTDPGPLAQHLPTLFMENGRLREIVLPGVSARGRVRKTD